MKDFEKLDKLLQQVISSKNEPDDSLNEKIIKKIEEKNNKMIINKRKFSVASIVVLLIVCTSITAFATWKLLTPKEIAQNLGNNRLAAAFDDKESIHINKTQIIDGYEITLMGIVSGKRISDFSQSSEEIFPDRTYSVLAISNADGTPMPDSLDPKYDELSFLVSPFIKGLHPKDFNIFTMNGAAAWFIEDGIMYRVMECDDIEIFADRGLYIAVMDNFDIVNAYKFNQETGELSRNIDYEGINALFDLPLDPSKGDHEKAEKYIQAFLNEQEKPNREILDLKELLKDAIVITESVQEITPDEDGTFIYKFIEHELKADVNNLFEKEQIGFSDKWYEKDGNILTFSRDADGIVTVMIFRQNQ